jgi:excisionase family DNA binding protein
MAELTTTQAAERLGVGKSTVNLWCRQGRFPNAYAKEEARGAVWYIPESDLKEFSPPTMGRPPKAKPGENGKKRGKK